jgi:hypothetical protein
LNGRMTSLPLCDPRDGENSAPQEIIMQRYSAAAFIEPFAALAK